MRRSILLLLLLLVLLLPLGADGHVYAQSGRAAPPADGDTLLTLAEYRALLDEIEGYLLRVPRPDAILPWMQGKLDNVAAIEMAPGVVVAPVNLLRNTISAEEAVARIKALQSQIDLSANDRLVERQAVVQSVLSQRLYQENLSLWDLLLEWLQRLWEWIFPPDRDPFANPGGEMAVRDLWRFAVRAAAVVGAIAIAGLLGWWLSRLIGGFVRDAELQRRRASGEEMPASAADARANAAAEARSGSYRQAVRSLYLSALLSLEEGEIVVHDRTLTNRELLARAGGLAAGEEIRNAMQPVVQGFDDVWYGVTEPDALSYTAYEAEVATLNRRIAEYARLKAKQGESTTNDAAAGVVKS
jgi:hypothetical protein